MKKVLYNKKGNHIKAIMKANWYMFIFNIFIKNSDCEYPIISASVKKTTVETDVPHIFSFNNLNDMADFDRKNMVVLSHYLGMDAYTTIMLLIDGNV